MMVHDFFLVTYTFCTMYDWSWMVIRSFSCGGVLLYTQYPMRWLSVHSALSKSAHCNVCFSGLFRMIQVRFRESLRAFESLSIFVLCGGGIKFRLDAR